MVNLKVRKRILIVLGILLINIFALSSVAAGDFVIYNSNHNTAKSSGEKTEITRLNPELEGTTAFVTIERIVKKKKGGNEQVNVLAAVKDSGELFEFPVLFPEVEKECRSGYLMGYFDGKLYVLNMPTYYSSADISLYTVDLTKGNGNYHAELLIENISPEGTSISASAIIDSVLYYNLYAGWQSTYADSHTAIKRFDLKNNGFLPDMPTGFDWGTDFEISYIYDQTYKGCIVYETRTEEANGGSSGYRYSVKARGLTRLSQAKALLRAYYGSFEVVNVDIANMELTLKLPNYPSNLDFEKESYYYRSFYRKDGVVYEVLRFFNKGSIIDIAEFEAEENEWWYTIGVGEEYRQGVFYCHKKNIYFFDGQVSELIYTINDNPFEDVSGLYLVGPDTLRISYVTGYVPEGGMIEVNLNYNLLTKKVKKVKVDDNQEFVVWISVN